MGQGTAQVFRRAREGTADLQTNVCLIPYDDASLMPKDRGPAWSRLLYLQRDYSGFVVT